MLENPYGLTVIKYLIIKYVLSSLIAIIIFIRFRHLIYSLIIFVIIYFIPNLLIRSYIRKEKNYIINDLSVYISNLQIFLVVNNSLYDSLKYSVDNLNYDRFKKGILKFIEEYRIYNYNIRLASKELLERFDIDELKIFIEILDDNKSNQNLVKLLSGFQNTLNEKMEKKLKFVYIKDSYYILLCIVVLLGITFITVMYPVFTQILSSLSSILN